MIAKEHLDRVLAIYKPEQRVLVEADLEYPKISGKFRLGDTYYTIKPLRHATDIEIQLCLNQLTYAGVAEMMRLNRILELNGADFYKLQEEGMFIIQSKKRFRKQIKTNSEIAGELNFGRFGRYQKGLIVARADFDFENGACSGDLELIAKLGEQA